MTDERLRIKSFTVSKLFGLYDHTISLNSDRRITIMHGENGVGKTVLLRLIDSVFAGRYIDVASIPFDSFEVELSDGSRIKISEDSSVPEAAVAPNFRPLKIELVGSQVAPYIFPVTSELITRLAIRIEREMPIYRTGANEWRDHEGGSGMTAADVVNIYLDRASEGVRQEMPSPPDWLKAFRSTVTVYLIETQRLLTFPRDTRIGAGARGQWMTSTVKHHAAALYRTVSETLARYASRAQALDQTFPQRLLTRTDIRPLPTTELKDKMSALESRRAELQRLGILAESQPAAFNVESLDNADETGLKAMTLYVDDTTTKFNELNDLTNRLALMLQIVNKKFRHKRIVTTRDHGLASVGDDNKPIALDVLSSGEQHELVLTYNLLFTVTPNSLVMIDEPELSFHINWQREFLKDIQEIVDSRHFDVLLATHSPSIVGDQSDLMISLSSGTESKT